MNIHFLQKLQEREEKHLTRYLQEPSGVDFCSNDYLSFASDVVLQKKIYENLKGVSSGSTSSRLIRGNQTSIQELEYQLAKWSSREAAIFFPSGYQANVAVLSTLLDETTLVFSDEFNHASIVDGIRLSKSEKIIFTHNDLQDLEQKLVSNKAHKNKIVVVESLYSMGGDRSPLKDLVRLCQKNGAELIVDEAHATGVFGAGLVQRQSLESQVLLTVHCAGKALGVSGAWIACDQLLKDYFINFCRPFIYSTAPSPLVVSALMTSLEYWQTVGADRAELCLEKAMGLKEQLEKFLDAPIIKGDGPILFVELGENSEALSWAQYLQSCELDVRAIRHPTVPENKAGLRISIHANQSPEDIKKLLRAFKEKVLSC
ncbi:8-amino-7-oxononanoate synthase [bacterium]|nr:8-amino-7-oxononanoate synthase [bacterium]